MNVTFSPGLTLELYAQPFLSSADFGALKELRAPRTYDFLVDGEDVGSVTRELGTFDAGQNLLDLFGARPLNIVMFKVTYWLNP